MGNSTNKKTSDSKADENDSKDIPSTTQNNAENKSNVDETDTEQNEEDISDSNKEERPDDESNKEQRPDDDSNKEERPDDESNKEQRPDDDSNKEERPDDDSNKEERPDDDSNKEERPDDDSNKEERPDDDSNKEQRPDDDSNKEERPDDDSNKEERPDDDSNKEERPDDYSNPDSNLPDDSSSKVSESALSAYKNAETTSNDDQEKSETRSASELSNVEVKSVTSCCQTPVSVRSVATDVGSLSIQEGDADQVYTFDDAIEAVGYGKFQTLLTMLIGLSWLADAFQVLILDIIGANLACEWDIYMWQDALLSTNMFVGMLIGGPFFGYVADIYGRRMAMGISMLAAFIFGTVCVSAQNIVWMLVFRLFVGFSLGCLAQGVTLCTEYYPMQYRPLGGFYINYYWSVGNILLVVTCWIILERSDHWRLLLGVAALPALGAFVATIWYPESVRFYLVTNQYQKAVDQLNKLALVNKTKLPPGTLENITLGDQERKGSILDLLRAPHTRTTLLFWYIWFAVAFNYYGLILVSPLIIQQGKVVLPAKDAAKAMGSNSTSTFEFFITKMPCKFMTNGEYFDLLWTSCAEIPGMWSFTVMVHYFQRKKLLSTSMFLNTVLILFLLLPFQSTIPGKVMLFVTRGISGGIFQLAMVMTSEVFPTTLRATSMGSSHAFSMLGAATVPYAAQVLVINQPIVAMSIISGVLLLAGIAAILLPREMKSTRIKDFSKDYRQVEKETPALFVEKITV